MSWCSRCFWSAPWAVQDNGAGARTWPDIWPAGEAGPLPGEVGPLARGKTEDYWGDVPPTVDIRFLTDPSFDQDEVSVRFAWPLTRVLAAVTGLVVVAVLGALMAPEPVTGLLALVGFGGAALSVIHRAWTSEADLVEIHDAEVGPAGGQDRVHLIGGGEATPDQDGQSGLGADPVGERDEEEPTVLRTRPDRGLTGQRLDKVAS
jgi:hypothetical protein